MKGRHQRMACSLAFFVASLGLAAEGASPSLEARLEQYRQFHASTVAVENEEAGDLAFLIAEEALGLENADYERFLRRLDGLSASDPESIADLAFTLQTAWENQFLDAYYAEIERRDRRVRLPMQFALALGVGLVGGQVVAAGQTSQATLLALRGSGMSGVAAAGIDVAGASALRADLSSPLKRAPSELLALAVPIRAEALEPLRSEGRTRDVLSAAAGGAAGAVVLRQASRVRLTQKGASLVAGRTLRMAAWRPVAWLGSLGLSAAAYFASEWAVQASSREVELRKAELDLRSSLWRLLQPFGPKWNPKATPLAGEKRLRAAKQAIQKAFALAAIRNQPLLELQLRNRARPMPAEEFEAELRHVVEQARLEVDPAVKAHWVRKFLRKSLADASARELMAELQGKTGWVADGSRALWQQFQGDSRAQRRFPDFRAYLEYLDREADRALESELALGRLRPGMDGIFLQMAAAFRRFGDPIMTVYSDQILQARAERSALWLLELEARKP